MPSGKLLFRLSGTSCYAEVSLQPAVTQVWPKIHQPESMRISYLQTACRLRHTEADLVVRRLQDRRTRQRVGALLWSAGQAVSHAADLNVC